jgi:hypothetical protein
MSQLVVLFNQTSNPKLLEDLGPHKLWLFLPRNFEALCGGAHDFQSAIRIGFGQITLAE